MNWKNLVDDLSAAGKPYLWRTEQNAWVPVKIWPGTLQKVEPKDKHSYATLQCMAEHEETNGSPEPTEIPFWSRDKLFETLKSLPDEPSIVQLHFRRTVRVENEKELNSGEWQVSS